jgi:hypothetical protein
MEMLNEHLRLCDDIAYAKKRELEHKLRVAHAKQVLADLATMAQMQAIDASRINGKNAEIRKIQLADAVLADQTYLEARDQLEKEEQELLLAIAESVFAEAKLSITKAHLYSQGGRL